MSYAEIAANIGPSGPLRGNPNRDERLTARAKRCACVCYCDSPVGPFEVALCELHLHLVESIPRERQKNLWRDELMGNLGDHRSRIDLRLTDGWKAAAIVGEGTALRYEISYQDIRNHLPTVVANTLKTEIDKGDAQ
jgi:hypothetical protein